MRAITLYLGGVDDALLHHVDVLPQHGVVADLRRALQDLLHHQRRLHARVLDDGHGGNTERPPDDLHACWETEGNQMMKTVTLNK